MTPNGSCEWLLFGKQGIWAHLPWHVMGQEENPIIEVTVGLTGLVSDRRPMT